MKLTRATDYAIRLLTHLASNNEEAKSNELAMELDIPFNHLSKLVQALARKGYLITRKGKGGGLKLAVDPKKISIMDIVETIEGRMMLSNCLLHKESCRFSKKCKFRKCVGWVQNKMMDMLSKQTIYDMVVSN